MVHACMKFLQEWSSPLTIVNFTLIGTASCFAVTTALSVYIQTELAQFYAAWVTFFTVLALVFRILSLVRNSKIKQKPDLRSVIGVNHPNIKQIAQASYAI